MIAVITYYMRCVRATWGVDKKALLLMIVLHTDGKTAKMGKRENGD